MTQETDNIHCKKHGTQRIESRMRVMSYTWRVVVGPFRSTVQSVYPLPWIDPSWSRRLVQPATLLHKSWYTCWQRAASWCLVLVEVQEYHGQKWSKYSFVVSVGWLWSEVSSMTLSSDELTVLFYWLKKMSSWVRAWNGAGRRERSIQKKAEVVAVVAGFCDPLSHLGTFSESACCDVCMVSVLESWLKGVGVGVGVVVAVVKSDSARRGAERVVQYQYIVHAKNLKNVYTVQYIWSFPRNYVCTYLYIDTHYPQKI